MSLAVAGGGRAGWNGCGAQVVQGVVGLAVGVLSRWKASASVSRGCPPYNRRSNCRRSRCGSRGGSSFSSIAPAVLGVASGPDVEYQPRGCLGTNAQPSRTSPGVARGRLVKRPVQASAWHIRAKSAVSSQGQLPAAFFAGGFPGQLFTPEKNYSSQTKLQALCCLRAPSRR